MSVVEFKSQLSFVERAFYSLFCKLVKNNYCGYPINIDSIINKLDSIREEFSELEYALDIFSTEENFIMFLIQQTHHTNRGFYNEEENQIYLLLGEDEVNEINEDENIEMISDTLYKTLTIEKIKSKRLTIAS